ncbi:MFS transporter [Salinisphaera hydrothermalis]|uniref:Major facilitator superfamily transport protein n=1 Tax=Salinisphaera hydrothermalis (strain C41B8) TaxID=1304275 RepID=A0A084IRE9_SALHC|nr:MFS transporter [Salinisphaera hydrothermalis]KEZ79283.1 major facilitator superfamily transport protein [Salinisphaera hydrothermalis C41B8]
MSTRYPLSRLAPYGGLGLPLAALGLPLTVFLPPFYSQMPGLNTGIVGILIFAARLFDVITDPLIGTMSDRTPARFGRRRPYIAVGTPILMLAAWFLFVPGERASAAYLLIWSMTAYLGWTLIYLPYTTMGAELSSDYDERTRITAWREGFFVLGTMAAIVLPAGVGKLAGGQAAGLEAIAMFLLVALPVAVGLFLWRVPEPGGAPSHVPWADSVRLLAANQPFRRLVTAYLLNGAANGLPAALFLFFVQSVLGASQATAGIFLAIYFLSAVAGLPVWFRIGRRWSKHRLWCASMAFVAGVFVFTITLSDNTYSYAAYTLICILGGSCLGVDQAAAASIQADVVDEDTAAGGDGRAGLYFGLWGMATKLAFAVALGIAYPVLWLAGFDAGQPNDATALWTLAALYGLLPVVIKIGVIILMWDFPLDRSRHAELQRTIGRRNG